MPLSPQKGGDHMVAVGADSNIGQAVATIQGKRRGRSGRPLRPLQEEDTNNVEYGKMSVRRYPCGDTLEGAAIGIDRRRARSQHAAANSLGHTAHLVDELGEFLWLQ